MKRTIYDHLTNIAALYARALFVFIVLSAVAKLWARTKAQRRKE